MEISEILKNQIYRARQGIRILSMVPMTPGPPCWLMKKLTWSLFYLPAISGPRLPKGLPHLAVPGKLPGGEYQWIVDLWRMRRIRDEYETRRSGRKRKIRGLSQARFNSRGNQGWLNHSGHTSTSSALSFLTFARHLAMRVNGGNEYPLNLLQLSEKAFRANASDWIIHDTKIGNSAFPLVANKSISVFHTTDNFRKDDRQSIQSVESSDFLDSWSAMEFWMPGKCVAARDKSWDSQKLTIEEEISHRARECVPPRLLMQITAVELSRMSFIRLHLLD